MPTLDVSAAFDASFMDDIVVVRRVQTVGVNGRATTVDQNIDAQAVVVAASPDDLQRLPEAEMMNKAISITTMFRLQSASHDPVTGVDTAPDKVIWQGSHFIVRTLDDYSRYGQGFVNALATLLEPVPAPVP